MGVSDWLVAFIPVLSFGLIPVIGTWIGGKPNEQSMGIALGGLLFSIGVLIFHKPEISSTVFWVGFLSGVFWSIGSIGQFLGIRYLGVARATPILNGGQIIGTSLVGIWLGDWASAHAKTFGFIALALIIGGIVFTSFKQHQGSGNAPCWKQGIWINLMAVLGFTAYVGIIKYYNVNSWDSVFPQSIGQITAISLASWWIFKDSPITRLALKNSVVGVIWGVGNIALLLSQARLGLAVAYPISQAAVIVSVFGGVFINHECKTRKEWISTGVGIAIICIGLYMIYLSSQY